MGKDKYKQGFSLVELLVVVAIIAILAVIAVPLYQQYSARAKVASMIYQVTENIKNLCLQYYGRTGHFPLASDLNLATGSTAVVATPSAFGSYIVSLTIDNTAPAGTKQCVAVDVTILGSSINSGITFSNPNYVNTNSLDYRFNIFVTATGNMEILCGTWNNQNADYNYLPSNCGYRYYTTGPNGYSFNTGSGGVCY